MDANGLRFQLLQSADHWRLLQDPSGLEYDPARRSLRLAQQRREVGFDEDPLLAASRLELTPQTLDGFGNRAGLDDGGRRIVASGPLSGETGIYEAAEGSVITDIAMGYDDVLYIAVDGRVVMQDRRERWQEPNYLVPELADFDAWRLAADPAGGAWVLDRGNKKLARLTGMPLHRLAQQHSAADNASHCRENTDPPRLLALPGVAWPGTHTPVALACSGQGRVAVLSWVDGEAALLQLLGPDRELDAGMQLLGATSPYSLAWVADDRVALLLAGDVNEAPVYRVGAGNASWPVGDLYPLKPDFANAPFLHGLEATPHYPTAANSRALHRLSFPFYSRLGEATNEPQFAPLDGGEAGMTWHRLYLEASIPRGCGIKVWLKASDEPGEPFDFPGDWHEHRFGRIFERAARSDIPVAAWQSEPSEIPHHPGLLPCAPQPGQSGLFSVLIQRSSRRVRALRGRYLKVHVQLSGEGRESPEIFALRAYGGRFSYIDEYLPELYRESLYQPEADAVGGATEADFFGRFVSNFEGILTGLEDRIANSYLLTDPRSAPAAALPWIGSWIGHEVNPALPPAVQRNFLTAAAELDRWHGTLRGLKLALEIATDGALGSGEIVVFEDFRLRRTFASILGADLVDDDDPLTLGANISGNSFVGDTLFIGDENNREFLALFSEDLSVDTSEQAAIDALFDRLAHRVTILVHQSVEPQDLGLIKHIARLETPAHVELRVLAASHRFLVGMAALVGIDSYLADDIRPASARVGGTRLGKNDYIKGPGALDSRLGDLGSGAPDTGERPPLAFAPDVAAGYGDDILLDGSESRAFGGRSLTEYNWNYQGEGD